MEQQKKLQTLVLKHSLHKQISDRLFHNKFLYKIHIETYSFGENIFDLDKPTLDFYGVHNSLRMYGWRKGDKVVCYGKHISYFSNNLDTCDTVIGWIKHLKKQQEPGLNNIDCNYISVFPGNTSQEDIRFKKRLPFGKYKYQLLSNRINPSDMKEWVSWASLYIGDIHISRGLIRRDMNNSLYGLWHGDSLGYVTTDKMVAMCKFKMGSSIQKVIEYRVVENE